jgi:hypothetical protein
MKNWGGDWEAKPFAQLTYFLLTIFNSPEFLILQRPFFSYSQRPYFLLVPPQRNRREGRVDLLKNSILS